MAILRAAFTNIHAHTHTHSEYTRSLSTLAVWKCDYYGTLCWSLHICIGYIGRLDALWRLPCTRLATPTTCPSASPRTCVLSRGVGKFMKKKENYKSYATVWVRCVWRVCVRGSVCVFVFVCISCLSWGTSCGQCDSALNILSARQARQRKRQRQRGKQKWKWKWKFAI